MGWPAAPPAQLCGPAADRRGVTQVSIVEWLERGVFVALAVSSLEQWRRRRNQPAAWLAVTFALLAGILLLDRFVPRSAKIVGEWFDRTIIIDLALIPYCLHRFTTGFPGVSRRRGGRVPEVGVALMAVLALVLPDVPGGSPASWPWWYALYVTVFLAGWTTLALWCVIRLWRCGRGQPAVARQRMRMLAVAAVVLNLTIFLLAAGLDHAWTGLLSALLFLVGFAPPPVLRSYWRRREMGALRRAEADLMAADTADRVISLMLPHAARLVGAGSAVLVDGDGTVRGHHGTTQYGANAVARRLGRGRAGVGPILLPDLVAIPCGRGWIAVATTASTPFFGDDELGLLQTLAHLAGLAVDRAELFDRERLGRRILADRESQLAEAQRTARLGSFTWDVVTREVFWSDEMHRLLGFIPGSVTDHGAAFASRLHPDDRDRILSAWGAAPTTSEASSVDYRVVLPGGQTRWIQGRVRPVLDENGTLVRLVGTLQDVTDRKAAEDAILFQATHDTLTGLPNRALLLDRLSQALARQPRHASGIAVLFLDVDRFKWLNDSQGHAAGDELLIKLADRLRAAMRAEDSVARFGGDEFVVLSEDVHDEAEAEALAARIAAVLSAPINVAGEDTTVTVSIGIAFAPPGATQHTPESLVRDADAAMYRAKEDGRNRSKVFDPATRALALARHDTVNALRRGIDHGELVVHYQPVVHLGTGTTIGFEALVRWCHPQRGVLAPAEFLALAEETGLIVPLGAEVLDRACHQLAAWQDIAGVAAGLSMSVNLAARQLLAPDLAAVVEAMVRDSGIDPAQLCLEITESALLADTELSTRALTQLKALGVRIGVDDFGTGFSSLTYLKRFPVDVLKIDRSFVTGLCHDRQDRAIVAAVVDLAHALGLTTVAEGVETADQLAQLAALGCEQGQGYLWSPPLSPELARPWITQAVSATGASLA